MTPQVFVAHLAGLAPHISDLTALGLTKSEAREIRDGFFCKERPKPVDAVKGTDPLAQLINRWDLSTLEIGGIMFHERPVPHPGGIEVGLVEADPLVWSSSEGLYVEELGAPGHVLWDVAKDGAAFLEAVAAAATCIDRHAREEEKTGRRPSVTKDVQQCSSLAGGTQYKKFYQMFLGEGC